jgi:glycosyltransferase involved in cell wall biosynthesis
VSAARRRRLLIVSSEAIGPAMGGTGIRAVELARALRERVDVKLASPPGGEDPDDLPVVRFAMRRPRALREPLAWTDAVLAQPPWPPLARVLLRAGKRLIFDLYTPEPLEVLEGLRDRSPLLRRVLSTLTADRVEEALHSGHHFVCAGEKQRDLWLGSMLAERVIHPGSYDRDPTFNSLLAVAPFGIPSQPPTRAGDGPRARFPAIGADDEIVLWNGGLWNWLDAPTAVRAAGLLAADRPRAKLVFMGGGSSGRGAAEARRVGTELGLVDRVVFFNDTWVPYERRADWLLEADCAVSAHVDQLETGFAFRTRLLDCLWAGLPIVCTRGDELAGRVERERLGETAPPRDEHRMAAALARVLERGRAAYAESLAGAAREYEWARVAEPIAGFVERPDGGPRLGYRSPRRPGQRLRGAALRAGLGTLELLRLPTWPRV